jgi:uncharacterized protein (DUF2252 family)
VGGGCPRLGIPVRESAVIHRPYLTTAERMAKGKQARVTAPRRSHANWGPAPDRPDPIALLEAQAVTRVPELVPIRYGRMLDSPFAFFRGAALIMASDLAGTRDSGIVSQICGDAHLSNFGLYGSPERRLIFDVNDFDETLPGPWEWDVKRLAASFEILGRELEFRERDRRLVVRECVRAYRRRMNKAATMSTLEAWYANVDVPNLLEAVRKAAAGGKLSRREAKVAERRVEQAYSRDHVRVLSKRTETVDGELRIVADPPLITPVEDLLEPGAIWDDPNELVERLIPFYRETLMHDHHHPIEDFRAVHLARKVVGVGSVGTRCWILLMLGADDTDPLFLQVKEAQASVLEQFVGKSVYDHHGERIVAGQRLMQSASDIFLGWQRVPGIDGIERDYYVRQLHDWKGGAEVDQFEPRGALLYARLCGATLARAHARSGDRIAISAYLGSGDTFDRAVAEFAAAYADQNERDYAAFEQAVQSGRLTAIRGV